MVFSSRLKPGQRRALVERFLALRLRLRGHRESARQRRWRLLKEAFRDH